MTDKVNADVGDEAENVVVGKRNVQTSHRSDPQMRQGDINFSGADMNIWVKVLDMGAQIRELTAQGQEISTRLDDLPARVRALEKVKVEVVVRPDIPEVVIRPVTPPNAPTLAFWQNIAIASLTGLVMVIIFSVLIYLRFV